MGPKWPICPEQNFFGTNYYYYFHRPIGSFHCAKLKKILTVDPKLWGCTIFRTKMVHCPNFFFFWKLLIPFSSTYYPLSLCKIKKKILLVDPELWGCTFFGPKMAHFTKWEFFLKKTVNVPCFFHSCLSTCQNSMSDINL